MFKGDKADKQNFLQEIQILWISNSKFIEWERKKKYSLYHNKNFEVIPEYAKKQNSYKVEMFFTERKHHKYNKVKYA